jgi:lysine-specific demethylase 8
LKDKTEDKEVWLANSLFKPFQDQQPLLLRGALSDAPAIELWKSWDYWQEAMRHEMAKIEIGGSYSKICNEEVEGSNSAEIPVEGYLQYLRLFEEQHGRISRTSQPPPKQEEIVYLAQNDLFQNLYKDIIIPEFCREDSARTVGLGRLYNIMLWLGPWGCVSPLHNDPLDNFFMQYMGRKEILLYPPQTEVYAGHNGQQRNTSPIEPTSFDKSSYPLFKPDQGLSCEIGPGDALYIPSRWWHFVLSTETSASVNVWWR